MDEVIEVIDSDDEVLLPSTSAVPPLVHIKTGTKVSNLPTNALNAGSLTKFVINPQSNPGNASVQYWDGTKLVIQGKSVGQTAANTAQNVLPLQTSPVRTVHNTVIRKLVPNQRVNLLLPTGQAVGTGQTSNATTSGNVSAHALLSSQNTNPPTLRRLNLPAATVGGSVHIVNAPNKAIAVRTGQMSCITLRANLNSASQVANPRSMSTVASLRGNEFVPSTYSTDINNTTNAVIRQKCTIKYVPATSRRTFEISSVRPPLTSCASPAPTQHPIYRNIAAPVRYPKPVAVPATPTGIASQNQTATPGQNPRPLGALMNLSDSAIRCKSVTVGNKTLSFNMAGTNYTVGVNKTSPQGVSKNNVYMFSGSTPQHAPATTATIASTSSGTSVTTASVAVRPPPPPLTIFKTNIKTPPQHSLKQLVTPPPQSADLPSTSSASTTIKVETPSQQQYIRRPRKSALGPSLACDDFQIVTSSSESPKTIKKIRKSSPSTTLPLKSNSAAPSNDTYEYSHEEVNNLNAVLRDFMLKPEVNHPMRIIAEERARINYMLSSHRLPQIKFKHFLTEEALRHELYKSLKTQKIKLLSLAVVGDSIVIDDSS